MEEGRANFISSGIWVFFFLTGVGKRLESEESIKVKIMHELTLRMEEEELKVNGGQRCRRATAECFNMSQKHIREMESRTVGGLLFSFQR